MPELPEVENRLHYLRRNALGKRILRVEVTAKGMIKAPAAGSFARRLQGRLLIEAFRRGKYLVVALDNGFLVLHFGMGGDVIMHSSKQDAPAMTRIDFILDDGNRLAFTCPRKICRVFLVDDISDIPALRRMGPEPLGGQFTFAYLCHTISLSPRRMIKPLLMDQEKIAGVGNIYADEILFGAGVRPDREASTLTSEEIRLIYRETRRVLRRAIRTGGEENFPSDFLVSRSAQRAACLRCAGEIKKKRIGGRTAYFCARCQK
ncbi:MAG: DNA-formamidopyrimidine glycosylase [Acidobacteriota bacterium]